MAIIHLYSFVRLESSRKASMTCETFDTEIKGFVAKELSKSTPGLNFIHIVSCCTLRFGHTNNFLASSSQRYQKRLEPRA